VVTLEVMKVVGVKELKAKLSEYLREVKRGEVVLVTDRDEVVAELRAARRGPAAPGDVEASLDALAEAGEVLRPRVSKQAWSWKVTGLGLPDGTGLGMLDDARSENAAED
jgi:antitoxin (DNA-binding transcriptional repressor) of toxin-antitoxin stability system